ncbi:MAG: hypothetical protein ACRCXZ_08835 [Patescibacteria group bacterium]
MSELAQVVLDLWTYTSCNKKSLFRTWHKSKLDQTSHQLLLRILSLEPDGVSFKVIANQELKNPTKWTKVRLGMIAFLTYSSILLYFVFITLGLVGCYFLYGFGVSFVYVCLGFILWTVLLMLMFFVVTFVIDQLIRITPVRHPHIFRLCYVGDKIKFTYIDNERFYSRFNISKEVFFVQSNGKLSRYVDPEIIERAFETAYLAIEDTLSESQNL